MGLAMGRRGFAGVENWLGRWIWAVPLLLVVTGMSARQLDLIVPEVDEFYFMNDAGLVSAGPFSPIDTLESVARNSPNHAPLYFILLNLWSHLVGGEIANLRVLTLFTGLLSLAMIYRLARDFVAPLAGLLALVVAISNALYNFYYANARMYPLLVLTGAITLWLYLRLAQSERKATRGDYLALAAASYALANTHVFSALLFVALGVYHLLHAPKDGRWLRIALAVGAGLLLFSPWLSVLLTQGLERTYAAWRAESDSLGEFLGGLHAVGFNGSAALSLLTVGGLALGWRRRTIDLRAPSLILLYFLIAFAFGGAAKRSFWRQQSAFRPGWLAPAAAAYRRRDLQSVSLALVASGRRPAFSAGGLRLSAERGLARVIFGARAALPAAGLACRQPAGARVAARGADPHLASRLDRHSLARLHQLSAEPLLLPPTKVWSWRRRPTAPPSRTRFSATASRRPFCASSIRRRGFRRGS